MAQQDATNFLRAAIGQGLGMGWGDEAEAWLRSKLGGEPYESELRRINREYGEYAARRPVVSAAAEFGGGFLPFAASMLVPGGQAAAPAAAARAAGPLARLAQSNVMRGAALGAGAGAVSGAGSAQPDDRAAGATTGAALGAGLGVALPLAVRGGAAGAGWARERFLPTEGTIDRRAAEKVNRALGEANIKPADIGPMIALDRAAGIPATVANLNPALVDLAETVAQRSGPSARRVEDVLGRQTRGSRERTYMQTRKALQPGNYYDDLTKLQKEMRTKAAPLYDAAYARGEVTDPDVLKFLELPQFQKGIKRAETLLRAEGRDIELYRKVVDPVTGKEVNEFIPTVESLDQVKRGLDALIEKQTDPVTGKMTELGAVYTRKKNEFLSALDAAVPEYGQARAVYRGDAELARAMRSGMNEFGRMDHEEVAKLVGGMSPSEMDAFRTGVVRDLYGKIMNSSGNMNAAQRLIGSPETQAKLQPLFDSPAKFEMFRAALERESQLFQQANRVLGGAATGRRLQARERFEEGPGVGQVVGDTIMGGFSGSLTNMAARLARSATMSDDVADKVAQLLMSNQPSEVAAAVKLLEAYGKKAVVTSGRQTAAELGTVAGTTATLPPAPPAETEPPGIEETAPTAVSGPDIDADIAAEEEAARRR
jgi:hypothetical protein